MVTFVIRLAIVLRRNFADEIIVRASLLIQRVDHAAVASSGVPGVHAKLNIFKLGWTVQE